MTDFDVIVVGAGPAGSAAALVAARANKRVLLIERGPFPGSKNMYGGVVYGRILDGLIPEWWTEIPVQRWITKRSTMVLSGNQSFNVDYRTDAWGRPPYNGCTTLRPEFDSWLAGHAERAGVTVVCLIRCSTILGLSPGSTPRARNSIPSRPVRDWPAMKPRPSRPPASTQRIKTPKHEIDLVKARLKQLKETYQ